MIEGTKIFLRNLLECLHSSMKENGFKKKNNIFYKKNEKYWFVIHFQLSKDDVGKKIKFTINIGVHNIKLEFLDGGGNNNIPDIWKCHLRQRIGFFLPLKEDKWWICETDSAALYSVCAELCDDMNNFVFPYFNNYSSDEDILSLWKSENSPGLTKMQRISFIELMEKNE